MRDDALDRGGNARARQRRADADESLYGALSLGRADTGRPADHLEFANAGDRHMPRLAFPFGTAATGRSATVTYGSDAHVRQSLELLIFTMAGERVMRPDLGSPVKQMVFSPGNGPVALALQATLQATIAQWLGHILELDDLSVTFDENEAALEITVTYETLASKTAGRLTVRKDLT